ncbi:tetraacyldisaccharide 4'-kinase [Solimonas marina]|uniref:Tetraacyldisaccharide 4'-kinase n=1 Tax=Solimonas marina TaxID=2714601 RepID=A0A969WAJ4_9GAMM|nr:tetraacyldisaccharide 4'-kinase [Solimonas marina]NKF22473.1 tetraacyldisaccharide 4'-kinase [Solimonas marina]
MKTALERRWYASSAPPALLQPLAALYGAISRARRRRLQDRAVQVPVPVVIVGNISVGGTGKTPFAIWLLERLCEWGWTPGVVSRGYGAQPPQRPYRVPTGGDPRLCGDEPLLIAQRSGCPVVIDADRVAAARYLLATHPAVDIILSDDGLQHYRLARNVEIALVDGRRGLGNGALLPAGPLREAPARLNEVDLVVINGGDWSRGGALHMCLQADDARHLLDGERRPLAAWRGQRVHAVAGIGDPTRFFATLRDAGLDVIEHPFADHHAYTAADLAFGDARPVLMTEKDAVKCTLFGDGRLWSLPVVAWLDERDAARVRQCMETARPV